MTTPTPADLTFQEMIDRLATDDRDIDNTLADLMVALMRLTAALPGLTERDVKAARLILSLAQAIIDSLDQRVTDTSAAGEKRP